MRDVLLLLWLRVRHTRWMLNRIMHLAGAGLDEDGLFDRAYQAYVAAVMLVWFALMASALVDAVAGAFALVGMEVCVLTTRAVLLIPTAAFVWRGVSGLRSAPLKLSHPDIAYLAASPISARALVGVAVAAQAFAGGLAGFAAGFLLGVGLESAGALALPPAAVGLVAALLVGAAVALGWLPGIVRLVSRCWRVRDVVVAVVILLVVGVAWSAFVLMAGQPVLLASVTYVALGVGAAATGAVATLALALVAPRVDMTRVIDESSLHADLCRFDALSPLDHQTVAEYQRRRRLADRTLRFSLPSCEGRAVLVAHAALSHLRQYDGIPMLVVQGALVVPMGVLAVLGVGGPVLFLFWLQVLVMTPAGVREATRMFRDDVRNRLVRDRLPFSVLELLVFDALPAFAFTTAIACGVMVAATPSGVSLAATFGLVVLMNAGLLLCCGLDAIRLFPGGPRPCYEYGTIALVGVAFLLSLFASQPAALAGLALTCAALAALVHFGVECAR